MVVQGAVAPAAKSEAVKTETMEISDEDAAFVLGRGGKTKQKIIKVSGCAIELHDEGPTLEFTGTSKQRRKALRYTRVVMAQRSGTVHVTEEDVSEDCTVLTIPQAAIGFVTGKAGNFLRALEDENTVLLLFAVQEGMEENEEMSDLMIFGDRACRRSAQLALMNVVETKVPGYYTDRWRESGSTFDDKADLVGDWGTTTFELSPDELSYAIGSQGKTRKKVARSSGCVVHYIGHVVFMSGTRKQRERAREYLKWLLELMGGSITISVTGRDDVTLVEVPHDCVGYVTGNKRETLSRVEEEFGALTFFLGTDGEEKPTEKLAIFGSQRARKGAELMVMNSVERKNEGYYTAKLTDRKATTKGFDTDRLNMDIEDMAYARGRDGATSNKLGTAANAIFQFVGTTAFIAGDAQERRRCRDYLGWLLVQRDGNVTMDAAGRSDVSELPLESQDDVGFLLGSGLEDMRRIERESGVFCMMLDYADSEGEPRLLVLGHEEGTPYSETGRLRAVRLLGNLVTNRNVSGGGGGRKGAWGSKGGGKKGGWRDRSRSPARRGKGSWSGGGGDRWSTPRGTGAWSRGGGASWTQPAARAGAARGRSPTPPWRKKSNAGGSGSWGAKRW